MVPTAPGADDPRIPVIRTLKSGILASRGDSRRCAQPVPAHSSSEVSPSRIAYLVRSATLWRPSLRVRLRRCDSTVVVAMNSRLPISGELSPSARS